jgi:hypothetical protein
LIDLSTFETKQIVVNPIFKSEYGGTFVTPNTDYVLEAAQYPAPYGKEYVSLDEYQQKYRGGVTYWMFDRSALISLTSKALRRLKKKGVPTKELKGLMNKEFHGEASFLAAVSDKIGVSGLKEHSKNILKYASKQGRLLPKKIIYYRNTSLYAGHQRCRKRCK